MNVFQVRVAAFRLLTKYYIGKQTNFLEMCEFSSHHFSQGIEVKRLYNMKTQWVNHNIMR